VAPSSSYPKPPSGKPLELLAYYESALTSLRSAIADVEAMPSHLMLVDAEEGTETARKYGKAAKHAEDVWLLVHAADAQLVVAREHVDEKGGSGRHEAELHRLLSDSWYSVTLSDGAVRSLSVQQTLSELRNRFEAVREGVALIDQLWVSLLPRIEAARETVTRLELEAEALGIVEPLIGRAKALAEDLAERLISDPLSVTVGDGSQLDIQVASAAKQLSKLRSGHDNLDNDLEDTEELLASLRVLRARVQATYVEASTKIEDPGPLVRAPGSGLIDGPDGLARRLDRLFETATSNRWTQKRTLLDSWLASARKLEQQLVNAEKKNQTSIVQRDQLRGRLQAYRAKVAATGKAEDVELETVANRARTELYDAPTDLVAAEAAIAELAERLKQ